MAFSDIYLEETDSTNRVAWQAAERGAPHGSGVFANRQTGGRGRLARVWYSPPDCNLYSSYILRPQLATSRFPQLTMVAGLSVARHLEEISGLAVGLKWPNDIILAGKKCGGILAESCVTDPDIGKCWAVIGIGLNLNMTPDHLEGDLTEIATSVLMQGGPRLEPKRVFSSLRQSLLSEVERYVEQGFAPILHDWSRYDVLAGRRLSWLRADGRLIRGISLGPDESGQLRVRDDSGELHYVLTGDVSSAPDQSELGSSGTQKAQG